MAVNFVKYLAKLLQPAKVKTEALMSHHSKLSALPPRAERKNPALKLCDKSETAL